MPTTTSTTELRELKPDGIQRARELLTNIRENPDQEPEIPEWLLFDEPYSRPFIKLEEGTGPIELRPFSSRREVHEYLAPKFKPIQSRIVDHSGVWSWLGMFYLPEIVSRKEGRIALSPLDETFVFFKEGQSWRRRYRHYLWGAWQLGEQHPNADFLLDDSLHSFNDLTDRIFSYSRNFNSRGIVELFIDLYTDGKNLKPKYVRSRGGLRHLVNVINQLARTYDIYYMEADKIKEILPSDFEPWLSNSGVSNA